MVQKTSLIQVVKKLIICIIEYNQFIKGVDKMDTLLSSIECVRKSTIWYKTWLFHIIDMTLLNSSVHVQLV